MLGLTAAIGRGTEFPEEFHMVEVVEKVATAVLILRKGQVVAHDSVTNLRTLMAQASLEGIFAQLTQTEDTDAIANQILAVVAG